MYIHIYIVEPGSLYVAHAGLELLGSSNYLTLASQCVGIIGVRYRAQPHLISKRRETKRRTRPKCRTDISVML